jgi:hypothetical protein
MRGIYHAAKVSRVCSARALRKRGVRSDTTGHFRTVLPERPDSLALQVLVPTFASRTAWGFWKSMTTSEPPNRKAELIALLQRRADLAVSG